MAITQATVRNDQLELQRRGFINVNLTALTTTAVPDVEVGSAFEIGGSIYEIDTADETPAGWAGISDDTQAYIYFDASAETLNFTDTAPSYSAAKGGWYSGDDRYVAKVYKNASGEAVQKETYRYASESADALQIVLDSLPAFTNRTVYSTAGSDTWVCPDDVRMVKVAIVGGGGGGGGASCDGDGDGAAAAGGGGAAGNTVIAYHAVTPGKEYTVTVGAGGAGQTGNHNQSVPRADSGGDSSFDTLTASGGQGGQEAERETEGSTNWALGGSGGSMTDDDIQNSAAGGSGGNGETEDKPGPVTSGAGGIWEEAFLGVWPIKASDTSVGGAAVTFSITFGDGAINGNNGSGYGAGGSGGAVAASGPTGQPTATGGSGADGVVIIAY